MGKAFSMSLEPGEGFRGLKSRIESAIRPAAQAGAQVLYEEAKMRAPESIKAHWFYGTESKNAPKGKKRDAAYLFYPGDLRKSIYQTFSKDNSTKSLSVYHIAWNHDRKKGKGGRGKSVPYGFMVEFGTSRAPAHPFLGPSNDARGAYAVEAAAAKFESIVNGGQPARVAPDENDLSGWLP